VGLVLRVSVVFLLFILFCFLQYFVFYRPLSEQLYRSSTTIDFSSQQANAPAKIIAFIGMLSSGVPTIAIPHLATLNYTTYLANLVRDLNQRVMDGAENPPVASIRKMTAEGRITDELRSVWFDDACTPSWPTNTGSPYIPPTETDEFGAPVLVGPFGYNDYYYYSNSACYAFDGGVISSGLQVAASEFTDAMVYLTDLLVANNLTHSNPPYVFDEFAHFDTYWRMMQGTQQKAVLYYYQQVNRAIERFIKDSSTLFGVFAAVMLLCYLVIYHPLISETRMQLKATREMLFLVPADVLASVPIFQRWLRARRKQEQTI